MGIQDLIFGPIYFILILMFAYFSRERVGDKQMQKYFLIGLLLKLIGAIGVSLVYFYWYGSGDTIFYFERAKHLDKILFNYFGIGLKLLFSNPEIYDYETYSYFISLKASDLSSFYVVKIAAVINIFCFNSYLSIAFVFAALSYVGIWKMFKVIYKIYPDHLEVIAISFLYIPSVFFWGSGLLKDNVTIGFLGFIVYGIYNVFIIRKSIILNLVILIVSMYIVGVVKSYILLAFLPASLVWIFMTYRNNIQSRVLKNISTPVIILLIIITGALTLNGLGNVFKKFSLDNVETKAKGMQRWHTYRVEVLKGGDGASYTLGEVEFTPVGILKKVPVAINVAIFRPWIWESSNPVVILAALESLVMLLATLSCLYVFLMKFRVGMRFLVDNPTIIFMLLFALIFAFSVGFTSYNFGALSRYRIPLLPFYLAAILIIRNELMYSEVKE